MAKASKDDETSIPIDGLASNTQLHGKIRSGYDIMSHTEVGRKVLWPHGFLSKLQTIQTLNQTVLTLRLSSTVSYPFCSIK